MKNMTKSEFQKKFRFITLIAAIALFLGFVLPAYWTKGNSGSSNKVIMMWSLILGVGDNRLPFSWIGFTAFILAFLIIVIWLARKFLSVEASDTEKEKGAVALDIINLAMSCVILGLFIILPISCANSNDIHIRSLTSIRYGITFGYVYLYVVSAIMILASVCVIYAEFILKLLGKKSNND